jgi:hypothetical protein
VAAELTAGQAWSDQASAYLSMVTHNQSVRPSAAVIAELSGNP